MNIPERIDFWPDYFYIYISFGFFLFNSVTLTFHLCLTNNLCLSSMTALTMIVTRHVSRRSKCFKQMHKYEDERMLEYLPKFQVLILAIVFTNYAPKFYINVEREKNAF